MCAFIFLSMMYVLLSFVVLFATGKPVAEGMAKKAMGVACNIPQQQHSSAD